MSNSTKKKVKESKRSRTNFTDAQTKLLLQMYSRNRYATPEQVDELHCKLRLSKEQIRIWFQNKRRLDKIKNDASQKISTTEHETVISDDSNNKMIKRINKNFNLKVDDENLSKENIPLLANINFPDYHKDENFQKNYSQLGNINFPNCEKSNNLEGNVNIPDYKNEHFKENCCHPANVNIPNGKKDDNSNENFSELSKISTAEYKKAFEDKLMLKLNDKTFTFPHTFQDQLFYSILRDFKSNLSNEYAKSTSEYSSETTNNYPNNKISLYQPSDASKAYTDYSNLNTPAPKISHKWDNDFQCMRSFEVL
ncbi:hypothetical protein HELRODRAFT_161468 [Helobdella robusta]|uniref:Homeobox domain-containing protein n=1 Tax=Helobdella robusta TaxID=6412 RepID=T1ERI0_HELRO|nr:hypothetical protein HELRODRAFT_161468 [Helobdella robusta]ESO02225.1 hypothetical protein HELRODRAFT_161468 [Helobdella robusta]